VIVGAGPAGLAAALYAARARRKTIIIEKAVTGGQIALASVVENYPGSLDVNGYELGAAMLKQAELNGAELVLTAVSGIDAAGVHYLVHTADGDYRAKAVILAGGAEYNRLGVPGEQRLTGFGVSYCATCDAAFFRDMPVAVVGGGDAAMDEALFIARYASKLTVIHRRDQLRASKILQERVFAEPKIEFRWNTVVTEVVGANEVTGLRLKNVLTEKQSDLPVAAVFIFIGQEPNTAYLRGLVEVDEGGHVVVNEWMETSAPGIFAAGDIRQNSARQVVTAAGDGATAAIRADHNISSRFAE